jgi:hypothetical protein
MSRSPSNRSASIASTRVTRIEKRLDLVEG